MIVSTVDIAPELSGFQNVWVQGVGCTTGLVNVSPEASTASSR